MQQLGHDGGGKLRREVLHEKGEGLMDSPGSDDMVVVEDEGEVCCASRHKVIRQQDKHPLKRWGLWRAQQRQRRPPNRWIEGLQGGNQVGEKSRKIRDQFSLTLLAPMSRLLERDIH